LQFTWLVDAGVRDWGEQIHKFLVQEQLSRAKNGGCCSMFTQNDYINGLFGKALTDPFKVIDMLSTHPDHERRGAGSMLLKWGTDIADTLGLKAFVQGSRVGKRFYERHGFVDTEGWITVPVSEKFKDRPAVGWYNLERPAKPLMVLEATETV
jgi:GNAT superfamily N-acetyltransferase